MRSLISFEQAAQLDWISQNTYKIPESVLMERAGIACVQELITRISFADISTTQILIVCGGGNNGGDGFVVARDLHSKGYRVSVCVITPPHTEISILQYQILQVLHVPTIDKSTMYAQLSLMKKTDWIVDGIAGIGIKHPYRNPQLIDEINKSKAQILAIDIPSGLLETTFVPNSDFIECNARVEHTIINADITVTMGLEKTAMYIDSQRAYCGKIVITTDVFPLPALSSIKEEAYVADEQDIGILMPKADPTSYKHSRGVLAIAAGCTQSPGAAILATNAALAGPAGLIYTIVDIHLEQMLALNTPSVVTGRLLKDINILHAIVAGSGWGTGRKEELERLLSKQLPIVLDADALHVFPLCNTYENNVIILTPHLGELKSLVTSIPTLSDIENMYWWQWAMEVANYYKVVVCAKHSVSCIVAPNSKPIIIDGNNPLLACGGSGDVLAGLLGSVLAYYFASILHRNNDDMLNESKILEQICGTKDFDNKYNTLLCVSVLSLLIHQKAGKILSTIQGTGNATDIIRLIPKIFYLF